MSKGHKGWIVEWGTVNENTECIKCTPHSNLVTGCTGHGSNGNVRCSDENFVQMTTCSFYSLCFINRVLSIFVEIAFWHDSASHTQSVFAPIMNWCREATSIIWTNHDWYQWRHLVSWGHSNVTKITFSLKTSMTRRPIVSEQLIILNLKFPASIINEIGDRKDSIDPSMDPFRSDAFIILRLSYIVDKVENSESCLLFHSSDWIQFIRFYLRTALSCCSPQIPSYKSGTSLHYPIHRSHSRVHCKGALKRKVNEDVCGRRRRYQGQGQVITFLTR